MSDRIGVVICTCAGNLDGPLDIGAIEAYCRRHPGVSFVHIHEALCLQAGQQALAGLIREHRPDRLLIAACSPREHEATFRGVCRETPLNPYMMQVVSIREHCAWVTADPGGATAKANALIHAALGRIAHHHPIIEQQLTCNPDLLVVGGGLAGVEAALMAAATGRRVTLIEQGPTLGGNVMRYEDAAPMGECVSCMMAPRLEAIIEHPAIEVLTLAEVEKVAGYLGQFSVDVRCAPRYVDTEACIGCGECFDPCPVEAPNDAFAGLIQRNAIYQPFPGATPNVATIDGARCLTLLGQPCTACVEACMFDAIDFSQTPHTETLEVGGIVVATGFTHPTPAGATRLGYGLIDQVLTAVEAEALLNQNGPSGGELRLGSGQAPQRIAILHVERPGDEALASTLAALRLGVMMRERLPGCVVTHVHGPGSLCDGSARRYLAAHASDAQRVISLPRPERLRVVARGDALLVQLAEAGGTPGALACDLVILVTGMQAPASNEALAERLGVSLDADGSFTMAHAILHPAAASLEGIYLAGCAAGPRTMQDTVLSAQAAVGEVCQRLRPGSKLEVEPLTMTHDEERCAACGMCVTVCPFHACVLDHDRHVAVFNEILCRGCGTCVASCPTGAVDARHFNDSALFAEIGGLFDVES